MQFESKNIIDVFFSLLEEPLKEIEPKLKRLDSLPSKKKNLPGLFVELNKISSGTIGIGGFIGYRKTALGKVDAEIYGRRYRIDISIDTWLKESIWTDAVSKMCALSKRINELLINNRELLRDKGIVSVEIKKMGEIESGTLNGFLPDMSGSIRRRLDLKIAYETSEVKEYKVVDEVIENITLG